MNPRTTWILTSAVLAASATLVGQGKPPKGVSIVPATATFRCDLGAEADPQTTCLIQPGDAVDGGADRLRDDGPGGYTGGLGSLTFYYKSAAPSTMRLYLGAPLEGSRECESSTTAGCNTALAVETFDGGMIRLSDFELHIKPLVPGTLEDFTGGPANMGCGSENALPALFHLTVRLPGVEGHWGLNYNARAYHSTNVRMTRTGTDTWTVETVASASPQSPDWTGDIAEIIAFNHSGIRRGKAGPSHEGRVLAPFKLTIDSDGLPTASTTCN